MPCIPKCSTSSKKPTPKPRHKTMEPLMLPDRFNRRPGVMAVLPPLIVSITSLMNELIEVLMAEPDLVMTRKFEAHQRLVKRKQKLAMEYRTSVKAMATQPDMMRK